MNNTEITIPLTWDNPNVRRCKPKIGTFHLEFDITKETDMELLMRQVVFKVKEECFTETITHD